MRHSASFSLIKAERGTKLRVRPPSLSNKYFARMLSMVSSAEEIQNVITKVASNDNLYDRGIAIGLDPFIVKNPGQ